MHLSRHGRLVYLLRLHAMPKQIYFAEFSWLGGWQYYKKSGKTLVKDGSAELYPYKETLSFIEGEEESVWDKIIPKGKGAKEYVVKDKEVKIICEVGKTNYD